MISISPVLKNATQPFAANQVILKFRRNTSESIIKNCHKKIGAKVTETNQLLGFQVVTSDQSVDDMVKYYEENPYVEYVKPNYTFFSA